MIRNAWALLCRVSLSDIDRGAYPLELLFLTLHAHFVAYSTGIYYLSDGKRLSMAQEAEKREMLPSSMDNFLFMKRGA